MKYQGVNLVKYLITLIAIIIIFAMLFWISSQKPELMNIIKDPRVSFISWAISIIAGLIAIFEFSLYKNTKNQNNELEKEIQTLKVQIKNKTTNINGSGTYVERNDGGMKITHG